MRKQDPLGNFQVHLSYNISPLMWIAFDATLYTGGSSSVDGVYKNDRQSNTRPGITAVVPAGKLCSIKFSASTGVIVGGGQNFTTYSIGWQHTLFPGLNPAKLK